MSYEKYTGLVTWMMILKQKQLFIMSIPFVLYGFIFYYGPLVGWTMAFQRYFVTGLTIGGIKE